jgi:hypothetical protein
MPILIGISMLIDVRTEEKHDRLGRVCKHDLLRLRCDVCQKEWETRGSKKRICSRKTHTCSSNCRKKANMTGGIAAENRKKTCLDRYGVTNVFASDEHKKKIKHTMILNHGVDHPFKSRAIRNKAKQTMIERYGVENSGQSTEIMSKARETMIARYGVAYPMQMQSTKDALLSGTIAKFGRNSYYGSSEYEQHMLDKFGVKHPYDSQEIREKAIKTYNVRYDVNNVSQSEYFANLPIKAGRHKSGYVIVKGKSLWFRSSYEERFLIWCDTDHDVISVDSNIPVYYVFEGKTHRYFIDFRVQFNDGRQILYEVKSAYFANTSKNQAKFNAAKQSLKELHCDSFNVITEVELKLMGV